jgi:hypothetical protein
MGGRGGGELQLCPAGARAGRHSGTSFGIGGYGRHGEGLGRSCSRCPLGPAPWQLSLTPGRISVCHR